MGFVLGCLVVGVGGFFVVGFSVWLLVGDAYGHGGDFSGLGGLGCLLDSLTHLWKCVTQILFFVGWRGFGASGFG